MQISNKPKRVRVRVIAGVVFCVMLAAFAALMFAVRKQPVAAPSKPAEASKPAVKTQQPATPAYTLSAMGDMIAHDSLVAHAKTARGYDFTPLFAATASKTKADVVFCNPETPVAGNKLGVSGYPTFNAPSEFARDMSRGAGCNLINLATNHMYDKAQAGVDDSRAVWTEQKPLGISGANSTPEQQNTVSYFEKNGIKTAFVAFADFSNAKGYAAHALNLYHDEALVKKLLSEARQKADLVVVSAHWGTEDSTVVNADQKQAATLFNQLGADIVIGTGPHVLQPATYVARTDGHKTLVWYSLGNFLSTQLKVDQLTGGVARMDVVKTQKGIELKNVSFSPTFMSYEWPAADRAAEKLSTRTNLRLTPLSQSEQYVKAMFPSDSLKERQDFVVKTLGPEVPVTQ